MLLLSTWWQNEPMAARVTAAHTPPAKPYHHGDLRSALIEEGVSQAKSGGPASVQLRDAARRVGVSHNAGYRHFADRDEYLDAVAEVGMNTLAAFMQEALAAIPAHLDAKTRARQRFSVTGEAYVRFALAEPGLFQTAFATHGSTSDAAADTGPSLNPYQILISNLDGLVEAGLLPPERRPMSEIVAWAGVHGLAQLLIEGPLRDSSPEAVNAMWARLNEAILRGL